MNKTQRKPPRPPMQLTCDACGKTFMRAPSKYKAKYNFCSEACAWAAHGEAVTGRAERVQILITCSIPVYPEMRPVCGRVYPAEKYKYRTNRTGYVVMCEGGRMQGNLGLTPVQAPCKGCADRHTGCHTDCTRYIAFRREADRYKQEQSKDAARYATTRGCMRTLHDANRAKREGRQHY